MHGYRIASWRRPIPCYMDAPMEWRKTRISQLSLVLILPRLGNIKFQCTIMVIKCLVLAPSYISSSPVGCCMHYCKPSELLLNMLKDPWKWVGPQLSRQTRVSWGQALSNRQSSSCRPYPVSHRHKRRRKSLINVQNNYWNLLGLRPKTLMLRRYLTMRDYRNFWPYGWNVLFSNDWIPVCALKPCMCLEVLHTSFQTPEPTPPQSDTWVVEFRLEMYTKLGCFVEWRVISCGS